MHGCSSRSRGGRRSLVSPWLALLLALLCLGGSLTSAARLLREADLAASLPSADAGGAGGGAPTGGAPAGGAEAPAGGGGQASAAKDPPVAPAPVKPLHGAELQREASEVRAG